MKFIWIASLYIFCSMLFAEVPIEEFKKYEQLFDMALKSAPRMSSKQLLKIADWADAFCDITASLGSNAKLSEVKAPEYTREVYVNEGNQKVMTQSPAKIIPYMKTLAKEPALKKLKIDETTKKLYLDNNVKNEIYVHVVYDEDYYENYIWHQDRIDVAEVMAELKLVYPQAQPHTLKKRLMLRVETNFRALIKQNPELLLVTKYTGLAQNGSERVDGHKRDLKESVKLIGTNKGKHLKAVLDAGYNVRMNALLYNVPKSDLSLFEALIADLFRVQIFGYSARIADKASWQALLDYQRWPERRKVLKHLGLHQVVELHTQKFMQQNLQGAKKRKRSL